MTIRVYANGRLIACKKAAGKLICAFPDVCFTPPEQIPATPPGVPVPYPNTTKASSTARGSKTVKIGGKEIMLKNQSFFRQSTGDEAGVASRKGLLSGTNRGRAHFAMWSMNVRIEGRNVVRHMDLTTSNHRASVPGNTPPLPYLDLSDHEGRQPEDLDGSPGHHDQ
ncbi:DUF4150 domain-containing protein [Granulosicoccus sp. 3-233]|uniref:DUF4150 domain-containing protein n=1 Tax=Granulosicoccus sp. 3-233 TaxID=3417969 RepID=UPI003D32E06D